MSELTVFFSVKLYFTTANTWHLVLELPKPWQGTNHCHNWEIKDNSSSWFEYQELNHSELMLLQH